MIHSPEYEDWTTVWPQKEGQYLFYGCPKGGKPYKVRVVKVTRSGNGVLIYVSDDFLYESTHVGYWKLFDVELPKWEF